MTESSRNVLVFGASGQIGAALLKRLTGSRGATHVHRLAWGAVAGGGLERLPPGAMDFVFANGLTDPACSPQELAEANLRFPQAVAQWSASQGRVSDRFLTLGTILERFPGLGRTNAYVASKSVLAEWAVTQDPSRFAHVRLHTVYGGALKPHMFLGQMADALRKREKFRMSSGSQLREYHHVDDVARFIDELLARNWTDGPILELSSGNPVRLADLARAVVRAFDCEDLLEIGSLPVSAAENFDKNFSASPAWFKQTRSDTQAGVIEWLRRDLRGCPDRRPARGRSRAP
jgi:nucleoside-diphosphate-sugar epimerase